MTGNCQTFEIVNGHFEHVECDNLQHPQYKSGFTGKSGPVTWYHCRVRKKAIRHIKNCDTLRKKTGANKNVK